MASVLTIGLLSYFLYSILTNHLLSNTKEYLNKEVELASNSVQKKFDKLEDDLSYYADNISAPQDGADLDHSPISRLLHNYPGVIKTLYVQTENQSLSFVLNEEDKLIQKDFTEKASSLAPSNHLFVPSSSEKIRLIAELNFTSLFDDFTSPYFFSGSRYFYEDGKLASISSDFPAQVVNFPDQLMQMLHSDISKGIRRDYNSTVSLMGAGGEKLRDVLIVQYPFELKPLPNSFAFFFVQEEESLLSDLYNSYLYLFVAMFAILIFVLFLMLKFFQNTHKNKSLLEKKSSDINLLFKQQTMLLQQSNGFVYYHDKYGKVYKVSENVEDVLGYSPDEFIQKVKQLIPEEDLVKIQGMAMNALENKKEYIYYEIGLIKADNTTIRTKNFEKLFFDEQGNFTGSIGICTDINEKYLADQELIKSENRLRAVLNSLPDTIYIYNNEGVFMDCYVQEEDLLLGFAKEATGKHISSIFPFPLNDKITETFNKSLKTGKMQTLEIDLILNGGKKYYEIRFIKLDDQKVISLAREITDQKLWGNGLKEAKEAAESASRHKSEFLANMSHEIRTPMNGLLGMIGLLGTTTLSSHQKKYVSIIEDSGESLLSIVNDILDYSKIEAGKLELKLSSFNFRNEIQGLVNIFSGMVMEKKIEISLTVSDKIPAIVVLDRKKLKQILFNIIGNAVKFTPARGKINITVSGEIIISNNLMLYFAVQDTGKGIPRSNIQQLTQPFIQVDSSDTREHAGTGLGLAIASKLIELMGGILQIESEENEGSEFSFTLIARIPQDDDIAEVATKNEFSLEPNEFNSFARNYPTSILLVEDNEINQKFMTMVLSQMGYQPDLAINGQEAVERVKVKDYDLIFMDHQMPKMNGAEATKIIRGLQNGKSVKIIGLSANVLDENVKNLYKEGRNGYLTKPVKIEEIAEAIKNSFETGSVVKIGDFE